MKEPLTYELLALDPREVTHCETAPDLLYLLRGYTALWKAPNVCEDEFQIKDGHTTLHVGQVKPPCGEGGGPSDVSFGRAYIVTLSGKYEDIEHLREPMTEHLKAQQFQLLYVLKDEVSEHIACRLYPHLYRIENQLRGYLIKFMSTRVGPAWWEVTVSGEMNNKVKMRKKNERVFSKHVENSAFLIDFDELGEIIYEQSSGFVTKEDILKQINAIAETPEAIKRLKQDLQTNYQKLFKESFADKGFREKWKEFETLRNNVAHNNLFTAEDLVRGEALAKELSVMIVEADQKTEKLVITEKEREAIQESAIVRGNMPWEITEDELLRQLQNLESRLHPGGGFVGISLFLRHLSGFGYNYQFSQRLISQLQNQNRVEVYSVPNPGGEFDTSAIRTTATLPANKESKATADSAQNLDADIRSYGGEKWKQS